MVLVVIASVFGTGLIAWKRAEGESEFYQELRLVFERMGTEFRNIVKYEGIPFEGKETLLSFPMVRAPRSSEAAPEWVQMTYEIKKDSSYYVLSRKVSPVLKREEAEDILLHHLLEIHFSYPFFEEEGRWSWKETWDPGQTKGLIPPFLKLDLLTEDNTRWEKIFWIPVGSAPPAPSEEGSHAEN